jgi:acyl dehydratase
MGRLWKQRPLLVSAFVLACALTLFFGGRLVVQTIYWANPAHHNQQVQGWMTVGSVRDCPRPRRGFVAGDCRGRGGDCPAED